MPKKAQAEVTKENLMVGDVDPAPVTERISIPPIRKKRRQFRLIGVSPLVSNNFSKEALDMMREKQRLGSVAKRGEKRKPKDFEKDFRQSLHIAEQGWYGFPATAFRAAMVDACRTVGYKMTLAKLAIRIEADGLDKYSGQPLVKIQGGQPEKFEAYVRLANGAPDIKSRGRWRKWFIDLTVEFDEEIFHLEDVTNLLARVGDQVGIGAGRPYSKTSCGQDWGRFELSTGNVVEMPRNGKRKKAA